MMWCVCAADLCIVTTEALVRSPHRKLCAPCNLTSHEVPTPPRPPGRHAEAPRGARGDPAGPTRVHVCGIGHGRNVHTRGALTMLCVRRGGARFTPPRPHCRDTRASESLPRTLVSTLARRRGDRGCMCARLWVGGKVDTHGALTMCAQWRGTVHASARTPPARPRRRTPPKHFGMHPGAQERGSRPR